MKQVCHAISDLPLRETTAAKPKLDGKHYCVREKNSTCSKEMMQSLLVKCWAELLWKNESLQLAGLCCVHLWTAGLGGVESM